jgi:hypothetical protein
MRPCRCTPSLRSISSTTRPSAPYRCTISGTATVSTSTRRRPVDGARSESARCTRVSRVAIDAASNTPASGRPSRSAGAAPTNAAMLSLACTTRRSPSASNTSRPAWGWTWPIWWIGSDAHARSASSNASRVDGCMGGRSSGTGGVPVCGRRGAHRDCECPRVIEHLTVDERRHGGRTPADTTRAQEGGRSAVPRSCRPGPCPASANGERLARPSTGGTAKATGRRVDGSFWGSVPA